MPNPYVLRSEIEYLLHVLGGTELVCLDPARNVLLLWNQVGVNTEEGISEVTWRPTAPGALFRLPGDDIDDYPQWVKAQAYSAMIFDGSLIQLTWTLAGSEIVGHRLAYIPCPLRLDPELLLTDSVLDVWDLAREAVPSHLVLRSAVRFDYDPIAAKESHPASHLTFNGVDCRIPVAYPLGPAEFFRFIFQHFYPVVWSEVEYLRGLQPRFDWPDALHPDHRAEVHLRWGRPR
jgi:hypothetical protein